MKLKSVTMKQAVEGVSQVLASEIEKFNTGEGDVEHGDVNQEEVSLNDGNGLNGPVFDSHSPNDSHDAKDVSADGSMDFDENESLMMKSFGDCTNWILTESDGDKSQEASQMKNNSEETENNRSASSSNSDMDGMQQLQQER
jgi:hypothetical protein